MSSLGKLASIIWLVHSLAAPSTAGAEALNEIWRDDRYKHAGVSAVISSGAYVFMRSRDVGKWESLITSVAFSVLFGVAKETYDREVDPGDIKADFVGAIGASGICFTIDLIAF